MTTQNGAVQKRTLANGLTVLTKELHHAPVTAFWVWYRVGSRNEVAGKTGISHWVEHMMFKGTERFPNGVMDREISRRGGSFNAMTSMDYTAYHATLPADQIEIAMQIEADRMVNSLFYPEETESERTVILSELHMQENSSSYRLSREMSATAFLLHPYRHRVIGWENDLRHITRDQLYEHYRTYYAPNNAIAIAVGDFEHNEMQDKIESLFGRLSSGPQVPSVHFVEPEQQGERRVTVYGSEPTPRLRYAYKAPPATSPDFWPLRILDAILGGAQGMFGGGGNSRTSRLYRRFIDGEIAAGAGSGMLTSMDPYLFSVSVTLLPSTKQSEMAKILDDEIARLRDERLSDTELARAKKQTRAHFAMGMESMSSQAYGLGRACILADLTWFDSYLSRIEGVTAEQVQQVAQKYLVPNQRTVGWYLPKA